MAHLLLDKKDDHIRRIEDLPFNYNWDRANLWRAVEIAGTLIEIRAQYPIPDIQTMDDGRDKWYCTEDSKWYVLNDRKLHDRRYDFMTNSIIMTIPETAENKDEEV